MFSLKKQIKFLGCQSCSNTFAVECVPSSLFLYLLPAPCLPQHKECFSIYILFSRLREKGTDITTSTVRKMILISLQLLLETFVKYLFPWSFHNTSQPGSCAHNLRGMGAPIRTLKKLPPRELYASVRGIKKMIDFGFIPELTFIVSTFTQVKRTQSETVLSKSMFLSSMSTMKEKKRQLSSNT